MLGALRFWFTKDLVYCNVLRKILGLASDRLVEIHQRQAYQAVQFDSRRVLSSKYS